MKLFYLCRGMLVIALSLFCFTAVQAQCGAGETEVQVTITPPATLFTDISWALTPDPAGTPDGSVLPNTATEGETTGVACAEVTAVQVYNMCLTNTVTYTFNFYDDWGDGWGANSGFQLEVIDYVDDPASTLIGLVENVDNPNNGAGGDSTEDCVGNDLEGSYMFMAGTGVVATGCTDPCFAEYDPLALVDDGSCLTADVPDFCSTAGVVSPDGTTVIGDNGCASDSGDPVDATCPSSGFYAGGDLWYQFTTSANCPGSAQLTIEASVFSTTIWSFHSDCSTPDAALQCGSGGSPQVATLNNLDCNTTYYLRFYDFGNDNFGDISFNVEEPSCDLSASATGLCNSGADFALQVTASGSSTYTITDGTNTATGLAAGSYNTVSDLGWAPTTASPATITVTDEAGTAGALGCETVLTVTLPGNCAACFGNNVPNDFCSTAEVFPADGTSISGDNSCALDSGDPVDATCPSTANYAGGDLWYQFTTSANCLGSAVLTIEASASSTHFWSLHGDCASSDAALLCGSNFGTPISYDLTDLACNTTYYLRFYDWGNDDLGVSTFNVEQPTCDLVASAIGLCNSAADFSAEVTATGTSTYTITDGTNTSMGLAAGTYNTVTDLGWPASTASPIAVTVIDEAGAPGVLGCEIALSATPPANCASCFGNLLANDACANAFTIVGGYNGPYDQTCADGADDEALIGTVATCINGGITHGAWYVFTGTGDSVSVTPTGLVPGVDTLDLADYENDLEWIVYTGDCGNLTEVDCSQDDVAGPPSASAFQPQYSFVSEAGVDYYFLIDNWGAETAYNGDFYLNVEFFFCDMADLSVTNTCTSATEYSSDISFTGSAASYTITDGTNSATVAGAGTYNSITDLAWPAFAGDVTITVTDDAEPIGTDGCTLTIDTTVPQECACFNPQANDACGGATTLNAGFNGPFDIFCNSSVGDDDLPAGVPACFNGGNLHGTWFVWTGTGDSVSAWPTGQWDGVDTLVLGEYENDLEWAVFTGDCGALTEVSCTQDVVAGPPSASAFQPQYNFVSEEGTDYYFFVDVWGTAVPNGPFYIRIDAFLCDMANIALETSCVSASEYSIDVSFTGTGASGYSISDGTNTATVAASGSYNTVADLGWPAATGPVTITVEDSAEPSGSPGCSLIAATDLPDFCVQCFGNTPDYDICSGAAELVEGVNGPFDTRCASANGDLDNIALPTCFNGGVLNGAWFTYVGTGQAVSVFPTGINDDGTELAEYENDLEMAYYTGGDCTALVEAGCTQDEVGDPGDSFFQPLAEFNSVEGETYYFFVDQWGTAVPGGEFNLRVETSCFVPFVTFEGDPAITCNNPNPTLTASAAGPDATIVWTLPDATTVDGAVLENVADLGPGNYTITATDSSGICVETAIVTVTEDLVPPAEVTVSDDIFIDCINTTGTVSGTVSTDTDTFEWTDFAGNVVSTELSFEVDLSGINTYTLTAYGANGCATSASMQVIPNVNPPTAVATGGGEITCSNVEVTLDGSGSTTGATQAWYTAGGTLVGEGATINVTAPGVYTLIVTANNGCTDESTVEVLQSTDLPAADAGAGGTITCEVSSVILDASNSASNVSYLWEDGDGVVVSDQVSFETSDPGTYTLTITDLTTGCSNSDIVGVTASVDLPVVSAGQDASIDCENASVTLFGNSNAFVPSYSWTDAAGNAVGDAQFVTVTEAGTYTLTVVDLSSGCGSSDEVVITADTELVVTASSANEITCETPSSEVRANGDGITGYVWTDAEGNTVSTDDAFSATMAGTYTVVATGDNGCTATASVTVTGECEVIEPPVCDLVAASISTNDPTTICVGDGVADPINIAVVEGTGMFNAWVITDEDLNILALPAGSPIDLEGAGLGVCLIWYVTFDELEGAEVGAKASDLTGCFELGDPITVTRNDDCICGATAASISTSDATTFCTEDGIDDIVNVSATGGAGTNATYVITDSDLNILDIAAGPSFNFEGVPTGVCLIWYLTYEDDLTGAEIGANAGNLGGCFALSNSIAVTREGDCAPPVCEVTGSAISTDDPTTICAGDGSPDPIDVSVSGGVGSNTAWVITDADLNILALPAAPPFDLEGAGGGLCIIWQVVYDDIAGVEVGANAADLTGCFALSNGIEVTRLTGAACPSDPCDGFVAIANGVCSPDHSSYSVVIAFAGGDAPNGYDVTNLITGVTVSGVTDGSYTEGPFPDESAYQYVVSITGQPACVTELLQGTVSCIATSIELMSFSGEAQERGNLLKWITASEVESASFIVERSTDALNFTKIGEVAAVGNSNTLSVYDFMDETAVEGVSYYRLLERNTEGNMEIVSSVISIERDRKGLVLLGASPVPAVDYLNLELSSPANDAVEIAIFDASGRLVSTNSVDLTEGFNEVTIDTRSLTGGVYVMSILNGSDSVMTRFVID